MQNTIPNSDSTTIKALSKLILEKTFNIAPARILLENSVRKSENLFATVALHSRFLKDIFGITVAILTKHCQIVNANAQQLYQHFQSKKHVVQNRQQ